MSTNDDPDHARSSGLPAPLEDALAVRRADRLAVFDLDIPIRWGDMDAMGQVNGTVVFRYFEQARISWFDAMGVPAVGADEGPVVINTFCSFLEPLRYPGIARVTLSIGEIGHSSVQTYYDVALTDDPSTRAATGGAKIVWIDVPSRRSMAIPQAVRKRMATPVRLLRGD